MLIEGARILRADGTIAAGSLLLEDGAIAGLDGPVPKSSRRLAADGLLLLPGIVDLHGDAFERQLMPRPGVQVPVEIALDDTDRQLIASGITTAFHGVTCSWEPGLRSLAACRRLLSAMEEMRAALACDTRAHLRFEIDTLEAVDEVRGWIAERRLGILGFNNHTPSIYARRADPVASAKYIERTGLSATDFVALAERAHARRNLVSTSVESLAAAARHADIPLMSHDDESPTIRQYYHDLGCGISEFPKTVDTATAARDLGNAVVMGAPNVMRGGSHNGAICATSLIEAGQCDVLASDYYYPSQLIAAFRLAKRGTATLGECWSLVSVNPAHAAGLTDRGVIAEGKRADLILVDDRTLDHPRTVATFVGGRLVFTAAGTLPS